MRFWVQIKQFYPHFSHKTDIYGRPVHYELLGQLDLPGLMRSCTVERLVRHHTLGWERTKSLLFPACCVAAQRQVYTIVTVLDLKGLKMAAFTKDVRAFVAAIAKIDQVRTTYACHFRRSKYAHAAASVSSSVSVGPGPGSGLRPHLLDPQTGTTTHDSTDNPPMF